MYDVPQIIEWEVSKGRQRACGGSVSQPGPRCRAWARWSRSKWTIPNRLRRASFAKCASSLRPPRPAGPEALNRSSAAIAVMRSLGAVVMRPGPRPHTIGVINLTDRTGEDAFTAGDRKLVAAIANRSVRRSRCAAGGARPEPAASAPRAGAGPRPAAQAVAVARGRRVQGRRRGALSSGRVGGRDF